MALSATSLYFSLRTWYNLFSNVNLPLNYLLVQFIQLDWALMLLLEWGCAIARVRISTFRATSDILIFKVIYRLISYWHVPTISCAVSKADRGKVFSFQSHSMVKRYLRNPTRPCLWVVLFAILQSIISISSIFRVLPVPCLHFILHLIGYL